jgi:RpiB/LacA/LacB family sugar-phosphate isomerase
MAEALFRGLVAEREDYDVVSAGVGAHDGDFPSTYTVQLMRELGFNLSDHRSRQVSSSLIQEVTHIFAMSAGHLHAIEMMYPEAADKVYLLSEFSPDDKIRGRDIQDPFGGGRRDYEHTLRTLQKLLPTILAYIDQTFDRNHQPTAAATPSPTNQAMHASASANDPAATTLSPDTLVQSIALGSDHGGVELKDALVAHLRGIGKTVHDLGTHGKESVDFPDFAEEVCARVLSGEADAGVLVCTTGIGMSITANRHPGIQAALVHDAKTARITREHNSSNVLCLAGTTTSTAEGVAILEAFISTPTADGERHLRRVGKMNSLRKRAADVVRQKDPAIADVIEGEELRQQGNIELIASENFASRAVQAAQGSCLTNKYAEGYPGRRWYGGCEEVDKAEQLAIDRVCELFGAKYANVQPHSGSQANAAVYFSVLKPGDKILTMNLAHGGHLTHGHSANFSGKFYEVTHYGVSQENERIDYDALAKQAHEVQPKMITAGASAYPREIDFARMAEIAKSVGAYLFVDMAHIAGLVAGGVHPSPVPYADFVTSTTHKSLRGPRGGIVLTNNEDLAKKINAMVFPGTQGGPLMHVIAAKAVCFHEALQPGFTAYQQQIVKNAQALATELGALGYRIVSGGTDNHLMLVDLRPRGLNGKIASETLDHAGITVNKNGIPFDTEKITLGGGIRVGTPAVTTRGMKEAEMKQIAAWMHEALEGREKPEVLEKIRGEVAELNKRFPLP